MKRTVKDLTPEFMCARDVMQIVKHHLEQNHELDTCMVRAFCEQMLKNDYSDEQIEACCSKAAMPDVNVPTIGRRF